MVLRKNMGRLKHASPVGDWKVAPPGVVWTEEGTHKGCPYGIRNRGSNRYEYMVLQDAAPRGGTGKSPLHVPLLFGQGLGFGEAHGQYLGDSGFFHGDPVE